MRSLKPFQLSFAALLVGGLLAALPPAVGAPAKALAGYDEIYDSSGKIRSQYLDFYQRFQDLSAQEREDYLKTSRTAFEGDNALAPLPRVLTGAEYDQILKPGVEQRAKALRAFLQDHYSGKRSYVSAGVVPADVLRRIISRGYELGYDKLVSPDQIWFLYGPDIIRDEAGKFRVIEDNPGFIGGTGDLRLAYQESLKLYNQNAKTAPYRSPEEFYKALALKYHAEAAKYGGKAVVYMIPPYADKEDLRLQKIFRDYGLETLTSRTNRRLKIESNGEVSIQNIKDSSQPREKVGFVAMIGEHSWMDPSHPQTKLKLAVSEIEAHLEAGGLEPKLEGQMRAMLEKIGQQPESVRMMDIHNLLNRSVHKNGIPAMTAQTPEAHGLLNSILTRKVGSSYAPGVDFIGDKEFYVFVEDLIRFYLKEEPILLNIATERFADPKAGGLNEVLFQRIFSNLSKYVIKKVDGRGGDAVWVGPKIKAEEVPALRERIIKDPSLYIVQAFTPLSRMNDLIVDMRVITDVSPNSILVAETPWGRGLPVNGNGKVNLSDQGREVTILVQAERAPLCKWIFK